MLTLRQIEVIRAVMVAGSVAGAARMLNVAQPGVSRTMKHLETVLGIKLFVRKGGRYVVVGLFGGELPLSTVTMAQRAVTVQGSYVGSLQELREVVELARSGKLQPIPVSTCALDEVSEVLDRLKAGTVTGRVVAKV